MTVGMFLGAKWKEDKYKDLSSMSVAMTQVGEELNEELEKMV